MLQNIIVLVIFYSLSLAIVGPVVVVVVVVAVVEVSGGRSVPMYAMPTSS
jgi:hypothetical protein